MSAAGIALALHLALASCTPATPDGAFYADQARRAAILHWAPQRRHLWCALVAQAGAESGWQADAVSRAGAEGPWQIMPATWAWHMLRHGWEGSPFDPWIAARVAAVHMEYLAEYWSAPRSEWCRLRLQVASYNAGEGNLTDAQLASGGEPCWDGIAPHLPAVTGRHASETVGYVARWEGLFADLAGLEEVPQ